MNAGPSLDLWDQGNPKIIWDGLGILNAYSGVGHHAASLYTALAATGVHPRVTFIGNKKPGFMNEADAIMVNDCFRLAGRFPKIAGSKPVFSSISYSVSKNLSKSLIYHGLSNINLPTIIKKRTTDRFVLTVHDLIPLLTGSKSLLSMQMQALLPSVLARADAIIAISSWTKASILQRYGQHLSSKIAVIGNGFPNQITPQGRESSSLVLSIARGESYKRLELTAAIAQSLPSINFHVVTDVQGRQRLKNAGKNITIHVGISDEALEELYRKSRVLLHTSLFEGWCLPVAHALSRALRVVYCSGSGIDEVCRHFPENSCGIQGSSPLDQWINAVEEAVKNPVLASQHLPSGLLSWTSVGLETLKIYRNLV